jgi:hypothetical protein
VCSSVAGTKTTLMNHPFSAVLVAAALVACAPDGSVSSKGGSSGAAAVAPSDDPFDYPSEGPSLVPHESEPRFVVPSSALPDEAIADLSNNNVDIVLFEDRLFMAWRSAPIHWAHVDARMLIVSSTDQGRTWEFEHAIAMGTDVREPRFLVMNGTLYFYFFQAGTNILGFEPKAMFRVARTGKGQWTANEAWGREKEIPWCMRVRKGVAYMTSYLGNHYSQTGESQIEVFFSKSTDGIVWEPVNPQRPVVYEGGVSEVAFEFDADGNLWGVTRNEDGDATGFGSHVCFAPASDLSAWECPSVSDPFRYDSPWMFRHRRDVYMVARRDVGGPFDENVEGRTFDQERQLYLVNYWNRPKRTALYRIDQTNRSVVHLRDLPGVGDTAFPSVRQTGDHTFIMANYTSPLDRPDIPWIEAQGSELGTQIYLLDFEFRAE